MQARMKTSLSIKIENKNLNIFKKPEYGETDFGQAT
jgi:hypothetical protein